MAAINLSQMTKPIPQPEMPPTIHRINDRGLIEVIDMHTGRVLCVQLSHENLLQEKWERLTRIDTPQGPVWIEKGLSFDLVGRLREFPYSKLLADLLCQEITNGKSFLKACKALNLEYSIVKGWERDNEEFRKNLAQARKDRAEYLHDEVIDEARDSKDTKTKIATLQWGAEKGDPGRYGNKVQHSGDKANPVTFVLSTGISRAPTEASEGSGGEAPPIREAQEIVEPEFQLGGDK